MARTMVLPVLLMAFSGTPRILPNSFVGGVRYVTDVKPTTSTQIDYAWTHFVHRYDHAPRTEAFNLFGPMRDFTKEEQEVYNRVVEKMSQKTGRSIFNHYA